MIAVTHQSPSQQLIAWLNGGAQPLFYEADVRRMAQTIATNWNLSAFEQLTNRCPARNGIAATKDIDMAWKRYVKWQMTQRQRADDMQLKRARDRRDDAIFRAVYGLFTSAWK